MEESLSDFPSENDDSTELIPVEEGSSDLPRDAAAQLSWYRRRRGRRPYPDATGACRSYRRERNHRPHPTATLAR